MIKLICFLAGRAGREAELTTIVKDFYNAPIANKKRTKTVRQACRADPCAFLDDKGCPLRLFIGGNSLCD